VYGEPERLPLSEEDPARPLSPYGVSKLAAEKYFQAFYQSYGLPTVCLRYFNVYGPRQTGSPYSGVISIFARKILENEALTIFGDGNQTRDFVHVADVVEANLLAAHRSEALGQTINIGSGRETSINELAEKMLEISGKRLPVVHGEARRGDIRRSLANLGKAEKLLGYKPRKRLEEGLKEVLQYFENLSKT